MHLQHYMENKKGSFFKMRLEKMTIKVQPSWRQIKKYLKFY